MNFVRDGYYKLNRRLLLLVGLWPYENSIYKYCQMILCNILIIFTMICQIRYLMDCVEEDWNMLKDKKELEIIERYTCIGMDQAFNDKLLQGYTSEKQAIIICKRIIEAVHIHKRALEYITRWQGAPIQAQKLLPIIMQRSLRSCKMVVGGMFVPSLEGFATIVLDSGYMYSIVYIAVTYKLSSEMEFPEEQYFKLNRILLSTIAMGLLFLTTSGVATEMFSLVNALHAFGLFKIAKYCKKIEKEKKLLWKPQWYEVKSFSVRYPFSVIFKLLSKMELPEERYYGWNRFLLSVIGLWPYNDIKIRRLCCILSLLIIISLPGTQIIEFRERVQSNWNALKDNQEIKIICKYGNNGKLLTLFVTIIKSKFWTNVFNLICDGCNIQWYNAPLKTQKQILFIMQKTIKSYHIDVGGLFSPSLEGFTMVKQLWQYIQNNWSILVDAREIYIMHKYADIGRQSTIAIGKFYSYRMERMLSVDVSQLSTTKSYIIFHDKIAAAVNIHRKALESVCY
ncbi:hypothetical protein ALC60_12318 [Trachymyrmex zeteki]|uniref:Odorant receptor n=1 Tax=Mycetomoellerius zeteki TaxID=64791 RepID=A0A151WLF3_9HYME|nr:hypothetical protein ALC60_12318 [Trachymyrmex zeteki]